MGMKVYAFNAPPGYNLPPGQHVPAPTFWVHGEAEYSFDGITFTKAMPSGIFFLDNGTRLMWGERLDPAPKNTKEVTFRITKLGDWQGPWEFRVNLQ